MKNNKKNTHIHKIFFIVLAVSFLALSGAVLAQDRTPGIVKPAQPGVIVIPKADTSTKLDNPIKADNVKALLDNLVDLAIYLGAIMAVFIFIFIGFKFVLAQGNPKEIEVAKEWFKWAVIGTALLLGSKVVLEIIRSTLVESGLVNKNLF